MKAGSGHGLGSTRRTDSARSSCSDQLQQAEVRLAELHSTRVKQVHPIVALAGSNNTNVGSEIQNISSNRDDLDEYVKVMLDVNISASCNNINDDGAEHLETRLLNLHIINVQNDADSILLERKLRSPSGGGRTLARNASARIRALSQDFVAYSHDLKQAVKCFSMNNSIAICKRFSGADHDNANVNVPMPTTAAALRAGARTLDRSKSAARQALTRLRFVTEAAAPGNADLESLWSAVEERFFQFASPDGLLARVDFAPCIGMKESKEFAGELFDALARKRRQAQVHSITHDELRDYWVELTDQSFDNRLQLFFHMVDRNADGYITEDEVKELIKVSASANRLSRLKEQSEEYAALIMEELDPDGVGFVEIWQLKSLFLQGPSESQGIFKSNSQSNMNYSQALSQNLAYSMPRRLSFVTRWAWRRHKRLIHNWRRVWVLCLWMAVMVGLFTWKFLQYKNKRGDFEVMGYCICVAKGAAETLKLNMALILLPVCRNTITWLRSSTKLGAIIPFDDNLNFHKIIAIAIGLGVTMHAGVHVTCDFPRIANASEDKFKLIAANFYEQPNYGFFLTSTEGVTGIIMVVLMLIAFTLATHWFRRSLVKLPKPLQRMAGFNAFWFSHHLFFIVYVCLFVHGVCLFFTHKWYQKTVSLF